MKRLNGNQKRKFRTRSKLRRVNIERNAVRAVRPRLSVQRTNKQIYAQIIDDIQGKTLASASTKDKDLGVKNGGNIEAAKQVGKLIAERAKKAGVTTVQFDRGAYLFHGRVKAVADAAREAGVTF